MAKPSERSQKVPGLQNHILEHRANEDPTIGDKEQSMTEDVCHIKLDLTGYRRERPPWQNVRRPDGILELRIPDDSYVRPGSDECIWADGFIPDIRVAARYNADISNTALPDRGDKWTNRPDTKAEKEYRKRIGLMEQELKLWKKDNDQDPDGSEKERAIRSSPEFKAWQIEMGRRTRLFKLSALSITDPRGCDFSNICDLVTEEDGFTYGIWGVYPSQIRLDPYSYNEWAEQQLIERCYNELLIKKMIDAPSSLDIPTAGNREHLGWTWRANKLRAQIAEQTEIDSRKVDRALCRMIKKDILWRSRIKDDFSKAFSVVDWRHEYFLTIDEKRVKFGPDWQRHDIHAWTGNPYAVDKDWHGCEDTTWCHWQRCAREIFSSTNERSH